MSEATPDSLSPAQSLSTEQLAQELSSRFDSLIILGSQTPKARSNEFNLYEMNRGSVLSRKGLVNFLVDSIELEYQELFNDIEFATKEADGQA